MTKLTPVVYTYQVPKSIWHDIEAMGRMRSEAVEWVNARAAGREFTTSIDRASTLGDYMAVAIFTEACMELVPYDRGFAMWQSRRRLEALGFALNDGFSTMLSVVSGIGVSIGSGLRGRIERNSSELAPRQSSPPMVYEFLEDLTPGTLRPAFRFFIDGTSEMEGSSEEGWRFPSTPPCDEAPQPVKEPTGGSLDDWMKRSGDVLEEYEGYCTTDDNFEDVAAPIELECLRCEGPVPEDRGFCDDCAEQINPPEVGPDDT